MNYELLKIQNLIDGMISDMERSNRFQIKQMKEMTNLIEVMTAETDSLTTEIKELNQKVMELS